jgi:S1-C subfamily serine protease
MPPEQLRLTTGNEGQAPQVLDLARILRGASEQGQDAGTTNAAAGEALRTDFYRESVGSIRTLDGKKQDGTTDTTAGTGFFVSRDGLMATDYHVVKNAREGITVTTADGKQHRAQIVAIDESVDLALLKVQPADARTNFVPVQLADSSRTVRPDDVLYTRGHPHRSSESIVTEGTNNTHTRLSSFNLVGGLLPGENPNRTVINSSVDVDTGNSGGFLARKGDNKVVGVIGFENQRTNGSVSTPVEDLHRLIAGYRRESGTTDYVSSVPQIMNRPANNRDIPLVTNPQFTIRDMMGGNPRIVTLPLPELVNPPSQTGSNVPRYIVPRVAAPLPSGFGSNVRPFNASERTSGTLPSLVPNDSATSTISRFSNMRILPPRQ